MISGLGARRAIEETLALARRADQLGYHRYWLAEHHAIAALADPCPEILLARLGAETKRMRIGTGGVLLPTTARSVPPSLSECWKPSTPVASTLVSVARPAAMRARRRPSRVAASPTPRAFRSRCSS